MWIENSEANLKYNPPSHNILNIISLFYTGNHPYALTLTLGNTYIKTEVLDKFNYINEKDFSTDQLNVFRALKNILIKGKSREVMILELKLLEDSLSAQPTKITISYGASATWGHNKAITVNSNDN